jgi:protease-4
MSWLEEEVARIQRKRERRGVGKILLILLTLLAIIAILTAAVLFSHYAEDRRIVVIRVEGTMVTGDGAGGGYVGSEYVGRQLRDAASDPLVEAIVLRVNSPGGTPSAAQEMIGDIEYARARKPVVASMGDMAASAAYHICSHTDLIYANPDTITGSIGSVWIFYDFSKNLEDEGIDVDVVKSGEKKDMTSSYRPLTEEERNYAQEIVNESSERFLLDVVAQRGLDREILKDARVFRGDEAMEIGLVDRMGNLFDAIEGARSLARGTATPSSVDQTS